MTHDVRITLKLATLCLYPLVEEEQECKLVSLYCTLKAQKCYSEANGTLLIVMVDCQTMGFLSGREEAS